jgi:hypothetical protein
MTDDQTRDVAKRSELARGYNDEKFCAMLEAIPLSCFVAGHDLPRPGDTDLSKLGVVNVPDAE